MLIASWNNFFGTNERPNGAGVLRIHGKKGGSDASASDKTLLEDGRRGMEERQ